MRVRGVVVCAAACLLGMTALPAQEREDRTLLSHDQMRSIVNEQEQFARAK